MRSLFVLKEEELMEKLTQKQAEDIVINKLGNDYELISEYVTKIEKADILHKTCGNIYKASINNISCGFGKCPNCRRRARKYTQESFEEKVHLICPDIKVISEYTTSYNKMKFLYVPDNQEFETTPQEIYKRVGYPFSRACNGAKPKIGINDMWTTHPLAASHLVNKEQGYNYPFGTNTELEFECPICKTHFKNTPRTLFKSNDEIRCNCCSDGFSYPEKLFSNILNYLNINYIYQLDSKNGFDWCKNYRYDFYLVNFNTIVETHGIQHYTQKWKNITLDNIQNNDLNKMNTALSNNISNYIVIDCRHTYLSFIKKNIIKSQLSDILDLDNVDWKYCDRMASKSKMKEVCADYNNGLDTKQLSQKYNLSDVTVHRYIKRGFENGLITEFINNNNHEVA